MASANPTRRGLRRGGDSHSTCLQFTALTQVPTIHFRAPAARTSTILLTRVQSTHKRVVLPSLRHAAERRNGRRRT